MALQSLSHPLNYLVAILLSEKDWLVALVEKNYKEALRKEGKNPVAGSSFASPRPTTVSTKNHEEALRKKGKNHVAGSNSASLRPAIVSTISSKQPQKQQSSSAWTKRRASRRPVRK